MRVVAGNYGGRPLKALPGKTTRPTTDKVKGAIFNMIGPYFEGGRALDLFAGSGALSIEAVSRGMAHATLIERDHAAQRVISENLAMTKETDKFELLKMPAERALSVLTGTFDLILLDPPYAKEQIEQNLLALQDRQLLAPDATAVCETDKSVDLPPQIGQLHLTKQKTYGISKITIYRRQADEIDN